jgi:hypothetical protein
MRLDFITHVIISHSQTFKAVSNGYAVMAGSPIQLTSLYRPTDHHLLAKLVPNPACRKVLRGHRNGCDQPLITVF